MMGISTAPQATDHLKLLLEAVSTPAKTKERLDQIVVAEKKLGDLEARSAAADLRDQQFEEAKAKWIRDRTAEQARLSARAEEVSKRESEHQNAVEQHRLDVEKHSRAVSAFEAERTRHAARVAAAVEQFRSQIAG